jgi:protein-tyrosine-phosphatase
VAEQLSVGKNLPSAVLFACTLNAIRSPMAAAILHHSHGHKIYVASAGIAAGDPDPFVGIIMDEIGIDLKKHRPHSFEDLEDSAFDLLVTLSPEAQGRAETMARTMAIAVENWAIADPSRVVGARAQILDSYRSVRDDLVTKIKLRFATP